MLQKNYYLHRSATDGYRAYLHAYNSYSNKKIFDINALDLAKIAKSFGFATAPRVTLSATASKSSGHKRKRNNDSDSDGLDGLDDVDVDARPSRKFSKGRQVEQLGSKKVSKQHYGRDNVVSGWSR